MYKLNDDDKKKVSSNLKKASKMHARQSKELAGASKMHGKDSKTVKKLSKDMKRTKNPGYAMDGY